MILNTTSWELVKHGEFIVGDRALFNEGVTYQPGDEYPTANQRTLFSLYENNQIVAKPEPVKTKKRQKHEE